MTYKMAKGVKITLTEKQENWLKKHFLHTKNAEIAQKLGISETAVHRFARALGLKKSRQYMVKCQRETADAAKRSHRLNGTYPPKGSAKAPRPGSRPIRAKERAPSGALNSVRKCE